ncbi:hypothetical protein MNBD_GAMMA23-1993 [hydrothermal vent metagenome]|uniref:TIGR02281 family clan AA aspartic protease n=1 Tax=hydrothermal vent metagenome TaxID=652676 RepID=A0A3B1A0J5_9ZZZZ
MHKNYCYKKTILFVLTVLLGLTINVRFAQATNVIVMAIFGEMVILKVDGTKHKMRVGDKTPEGIVLAEIDYDTVILKQGNKSSRHKLGGHVSFGLESGRGKGPKKEQIAKIWPKNDMYVTHGYINKFSVTFMVDTGATWIALSESMAKRMGINYFRGERGYAGTASGVTSIYKIKLDSVRVGEIRLYDVEAAVIPNLSGHVLLGNSFLKYTEMTRTKQVMILKKK